MFHICVDIIERKRYRIKESFVFNVMVILFDIGGEKP